MKNLTFSLKSISILVGILFINSHIFAQLSGIKTIPGDYSSIASAVTNLNTAGVGTGGVTFNIAANYTETISATISLTATGTASNPIVFQKDHSTTGANPLITAYTGGAGTPATPIQDGIWRLIGSDHVTIDGIDLRDNAANTTNPSTMEYGYALYKASTSNGCQFVTIENCTITLNNINNATGGNPMTDGAAGIIVMNATATAANVVLTPVAGGSNSNNKFYSNTIQNCNIGISMIGYAAASPFTLADTNNDIGGNTASTGNTIINYGGAAGATNPAAAIRTLAQYGLNVSYNTINNNNGSGINHPNTLRGLYINAATSASTAITYNTITLNGGGTTQNITGIENVSGSTPASNTVTINNNTITNSTYTTATTGGFFGIFNNASSPATLSISNNSISNNASSATGTGFFYGIDNSGAATTATINGNSFTGNSTAALTTGLFTGIINSGAAANLTINSNTLAGNSTTATAGVYFPVYNSGIVTTTININSNNIGTSTLNAITFNAANAGAQIFINNTKGAATAALSISNNNFQGINYAVAGTGTNTYISNTAPTLSQAINNNTFTNLNVNTTGSITFISNSVAVPATGTQNVNGNSISGTFNKAGAGNTVTLFTSAATSLAGAVINNNNNNFSNITVTGTTIIAGWANTDAGSSTKTIQNNIFSNWVGGTGAITAMSVSITGTANATTGNSISNITGAGAITGITTGAGNNNIYYNTIDSLTSTGASAVTGISITAGANNKIYKNKIYALQASILGGTVNGILVSGTTLVKANIYNNLVGDLRTPLASAADPVRGISVTATAVNSTVNVYYNTIYINATSSGTNFGTSGIYHTASATATTAALTLTDNIIFNTSIPNGTGLTVAFRRSSTSLNNYTTASNNNLFYAGACSATRPIFYDGTNSDQVLSSYKTRVSTRDSLSVTEDISSDFLSTTGSSLSYLHMNPAIATQVESGGVSITNYADDYDGDTRYGNTGYAGSGSAPDIGADEFNGVQASGLSGTYNVGAGQIYTSLTKAGGLFAAINTYGLDGNIIVNITSDLSEDGSNTLYKWVESGTGNYTVTIQPDASTLRTISGDVLGGLIRFNNAGRVTIDGSNGTNSNYLTFRNLNAAGTTGTAFTFINGATNNTIKYSNVEAYTNATSGVILFGTSAIAGGNSNNTISNCNINATVNSNTGNVCIYSAGTVGNENSTNTILNNNIYNYRDRALDITSTGSTAWTISGNSLYNGSVTGAVNYAAAYTLHGIRILGGAGYSILNNYIGGNAALASGTNAVYSSTLGLLTFQGILLTTSSATPASYIQGNTIASIAVSCVPTASSSVVFEGIETNGSGITIGGTLAGNGNTVGSNTANSSITITTSTTVNKTSLLRGIYCNSTGGIISGNQIGGIDISNTGTVPGASTFNGIYVNSAAAPSVSNNIIGSTGSGAAPNSIRVLSSSTSTTTALTGIAIGAAVTSTIQVSGNTVQNLSHQSATASGIFTGISNAATTTAVVTITGNTITGNTNNATTGGWYGIYSNASPSSLTITNNTISNNISTATTTGFLYGINTVGTPASVAINNNIFSGNSTATLSTGLFAGIYNTANPATLTINTNSFYGNSTTETSGAYYPVYQAGAVTSTININSNNIGTAISNAITYSAANSGAQYFIYNTGGTATAALSISNNNFQGINYAVAGTGADNYIVNSAATLSQAINGNTFTNLNVNTAGSTIFISDNVIVPATGTQNVSNNSIAGTFTKAAGGTITLFTSGASSVAGSVINNNNNNFSNITVTGATIISGWVNTDAGSSAKTIQNNTFTNWTGGTGAITAMSVNVTGTNNATSGNLVSNISSAGAITGIATAAGNDNIYSNIIDTLSSTGAAAVTAIAVTAGTSKKIYQNKIYDNTGSNATSTVNGILVSGGTAVTVYNNLIGNLRATAATSSADAIRGISITSATASSAINVYYNTIYLNAASTGTNFSTAGIYHVASATATTAALNLRNNIIVNTSTPKGTGSAVAYRRSATTLANYVSTSNNNLFYAGTPATTSLVFSDGTNSDQTITTYKTRVANRDSLSVTENPTAKFLSTLGSSSLFLHVSSTIPTLIESGAANIAGITIDYDGQIRAGNTGYTGNSSSPDIGADEINGLDSIPPTITYTLLSNTTATSNRSITGITITDNSGINTATGTRPRIYYKRYSDANTLIDNTSSTNGWKYTEATNSTSPYTFTIDYTLLYGGSNVTAGAIQYFVVAQDLATIPNVAVNSGTFTVTPSSVGLKSSAFPIGGTINSYNIPFTGIYNVGTTEVFTSLTKAGGLFAAINSAGLAGNTIINVTSDLTEDGTNALNQWTESGAGNYTLTIQPDAATLRTVSGDALSGLVRFNGADRVTVDGSNGGSGSYLSFKNTNASGTTGTAFTFINGATNNTIRYCDAEAYADATDGVILFGTSSVTGGNSNDLIDNCTIAATINGHTGNTAIYSAGTVGNENSSNTISNSSIYNYRDRAIDISSTGSSAWTITGNSFYNGSISSGINYAASYTLHGIRILGGSGYSILNNYIGGNAALASGINAVYASTLGNLSYQGILLTTSSATPASYIRGNTIAAISLSSVPTAAASNAFTGIETNGAGISIGGTSAGNGNIIGSAAANGSVIVTTTTTSTTNTSLIKAINCSSTGGIVDGNQVAGIDINNIGIAPAASTFHGIYINGAAAPSEVNNNIIGSSSTLNSIRVLSSSSATTTSLTGISLGASVNSGVLVNNNVIENISQLSSTSSGIFTGINNGASAGASVTINSDTIQNISSVSNSNSGSSVYSGIISSAASTISNNIINSITLASSGTNAQVTAINVSGAFAHIISGNTITTLSTASAKVSVSVETSSPAGSAIVGILNAATVSGQVISGNIVSGLISTTTSSLNTVVTGIGISASASGNIYNNRISAFKNTATGSNPGICGIMASGGSFNVYNNSIRVSNSSNANGVALYGIDHATGNNWNYYYNTIKISGSATGTALRSAAFLRTVNGSLVLRDNVLVNTRAGSGSNYAISNIVATPATSWPGTASDYNDLYSTNPATIGEWGVAVSKTFTLWQTASGGEAHSVTHPVSFISSAYDLQPDSTTNCSLNNTGIPVTAPLAINTDLNANSRNATNPDMGAYEFNYTIFTVTADNSSPVCSGSTISFTADPGNAVNATYSWTNPKYAIVATTQNPGVIASIAGNYTVTVTDIYGCIDSATTVVSLNARPTGRVSGTGSICNGNNATITLTVAGSGTINGVLNNGDTFSGTAPTISITESPTAATTYTIASMNDAGCTSQSTDLSDSAVITVNYGIWTGAVNTDWSNAGNWCGGAPTGTTDVTIPPGLANYPVIATADSVRNISIASGASLTIAASNTFTIAGTFTDSGTIANNGTLVMKGTSAQSFPGSTATVSAMNNLTINNAAGVTINNSFSLTGTLTPKSGIIDLGNKNITLYSDAANTANVATVGGGFAYSGGGNFIVQRYIPAKRAWYLMTAPVTSSNSIYNSWQNGGVYTPGKGVLITGLSPTVANGLDASPSNTSTLKSFSIATQGLAPVTNTNINISPGNNGSADNAGYFIFIRGDRNTATIGNPYITNIPLINTTLSCMGKLQTGTQTFTASANASGYTLIGNPYASPIDFNNVTRNNIIKRFYVWDPTLNVVGGYVLLDDVLNSGTFTSSVLGSAQGKDIQSGQAFFVQTLSAGAASLVVNESSRSSVNNNLVFRPASVTQGLNVTLNLLNPDSSATLADGTLAQFNNMFSDTFNIYDARKFANVNESIGFLKKTVKLAIERRPLINPGDTLSLSLTNTTQRKYQFVFTPDSWDQPGVTGFLADSYLGTQTPVSLTDTTAVNFSIDSTIASQAAGRFKIVFRPSGILPVTFISIKATEQKTTIAVNWNVTGQLNIKEYTIERSADGNNFNKIAAVSATGNVSSTIAYNWVDVKPFAGNNYYRIISVATDGAMQYSQVVNVKRGINTTGINVYPNPVTNNVVGLQLNDFPAGNYCVHLLNDAGQIIQTKIIEHEEGSSTETISLNKSIAKGTYYLEVTGPDNKRRGIEIFIN